MAAIRRSTRLIDKANGTTGPRTRRPPETIKVESIVKSTSGRKRSSSKTKSIKNKDIENVIPEPEFKQQNRNETNSRKRTQSSENGGKIKQHKVKSSISDNTQPSKTKVSVVKFREDSSSTKLERKSTHSTKQTRSTTPAASKIRDPKTDRRPQSRISTEVHRDDNYARRLRATQHRLFLVGRRDSAQDLADDNLTYVVMGTTGNIYYCTLTSQTIRCTCVDQRVRKVFCKHLLFVMLKVLKIPETHPIIKRKNAHLTYEELAEIYTISRQSTPEKEAVAPEQVRRAWQSATGHAPALDNHEIAQPAPQREIASDDDCPICFEVLDDGEPLEYCKGSCGRSVHAECFGKWASSKQRTHEPVTIAKSKDSVSISSRLLKFESLCSRKYILSAYRCIAGCLNLTWIRLHSMASYKILNDSERTFLLRGHGSA